MNKINNKLLSEDNNFSEKIKQNNIQSVLTKNLLA